MRLLKIRLFLKLWLICLGLSFCLSANGQLLGDDVMGDKSKIEIPFSFESGFILTKVTFQNWLPLNLIFDTGAEHTIIFNEPIAQLLQLKYDQVINIYGSDLSETVDAFISRQIPMKMPKTETVLRDLVIVNSDSLKLEQLTGKRIDGILGANFFRGLKVQIDYDRKKIILYKGDANIKDLDKYEGLPIDIVRFKPYLTVKVLSQEGNIDSLKMLVDTGASLGLLIHSNTDPNLETPPNAVNGILGRGLGGDLGGFMGRVASLNFGPFEFPQIISNYQDIDSSLLTIKKIVRNGLIGNPLLSRFDVIIDYVNSTLYLKADKDYNREFDYDRSGLSIYAFGKDLKDYYVRFVHPNSPAYDAGLRAGDVIKKIGWWSTRWYSIQRLNRKFQQKEGKTIKLMVERQGEKLKYKFKLRNWFDEIPIIEKNDAPIAEME